jgi:hypothetical protein
MSRGTLSAVAVAVSLVCMSLSGCTVMNSETPEAHCPSNTIGRELSDLKVARDNGAVSDDEYRAAKDKLLATYGKR